MALIYATPQSIWPVLGLHGQRLGTVQRCAIDVEIGEIKYLEMKTPWQVIDIDWLTLEFDTDRQAFRIIPPLSQKKS